MIGTKKDFISFDDLSPAELQLILDTAVDLKKKRRHGEVFHPLAGKVLGMIFAKSSTRTRVSFEVGIYQLGGMGIFLSQSDIQLGRGETIEDTGRVLERYIDGVMIRTYNHQDVVNLAKYSSIPVINGLTDYNHPCQIMADFQTIFEHFGSLEGIKLAYIGDGNNIANSLALGGRLTDMEIAIASPPGYECPDSVKAAVTGAKVSFSTDPMAACREANVIYTDVWTSMGQEKEQEQRLRDLADFQVNKTIADCADKDYIFLHCLPAHRGEEVTADILDGKHSMVFEQAENRLHAQKAIMYLLMDGKR